MSSANVDVLKCLCRLCAKQDKHCVHVFSNDGNKHFIEKKIRLCLPITIRENDILPQQICLSCLNKLDTCYELYSGCVSAQSTIMKLIESSDVFITDITCPNPLIKVRKACSSNSSPNTSASSPISFQDFLKQDYNQPTTVSPQTKVINIDSDITSRKSANEDNNETNSKLRRHSDSGHPRIKLRKLDTEKTTDSEKLPVETSREPKIPTGTELVNTNLSTDSVLQTVEDHQVSTCNPMATTNISTNTNAVPTDSSSAHHNMIPKITNLHSLAKPVSCIMSTAPTIMTSDSGGYQLSTQSINGMQAPQNVYLTSISNSIAEPCTQLMVSPISSTYVASQTLVPSRVLASTYITSPPENQVTQAITPNYLIQQQPIYSGTTTSNALVYMNRINPETSLLPQNTSQHINFAVSSAASNNKIFVAPDPHQLQSSSQNSDVSVDLNKFASNTAADKASTSATSSIFVSQSPLINSVQSRYSKTYERVTKVPWPQTDSVSQNVLLQSPVINSVQSLALKTFESVQQVANTTRPKTDSVSQNAAFTMNNGSSTQGRIAELKSTRLYHEMKQQFMGVVNDTDPEDIENGNVGNKITSIRNSGLISKLKSQVKVTMPNRSSLKNDCSANKNLNNKVGTVMATNINPVGVPHTGSSDACPPPPIFFEQKSTVAAKRSSNNLRQYTKPSSRTSLNNSLSTATNSRVVNGPSVGQQATVANRVHDHISRPAPSSTLPKNLTTSPANICNTSQNPSSASISVVHISSLLRTNAVSVNGTTTASPTAIANSVSAERHNSVMDIKEENELRTVRTDKQKVDSNGVEASSSTDSLDSRSSNDKNKCPYCNIYFAPDILIHHKVLHFREKFFSCIDCGKNFKTEIGLQRHRCEGE